MDRFRGEGRIDLEGEGRIRLGVGNNNFRG